jgi:hypothetical protein
MGIREILTKGKKIQNSKVKNQKPKIDQSNSIVSFRLWVFDFLLLNFEFSIRYPFLIFQYVSHKIVVFIKFGQIVMPSPMNPDQCNLMWIDLLQLLAVFDGN